RRPCLRCLCFEHVSQQRTVDGMMTLQSPKCFAAQSIVLTIILIEASHPFRDGGCYDFSRPIAQFAARAVARARLVFAKLIEQVGLPVAVLRHRFEQLLLRVDESIDPAAEMIAVWIALRVLHVTNEGVAPVAEPQRAVRSNLRIDRPEILVGADE